MAQTPTHPESSVSSRRQETPRSIFDYEILHRIGEGAGSAIYAARHPGSQQVCALKHVKVRSAKDERFVYQLEGEMEVGRLVHHRGLRRSLDLKITRSWLRRPIEAALIMELVDGVPLDSGPRLNASALIDVFIQIGNALHSLHGLGYVHCDIKPGNVLLAKDLHAVVIDLGQACRIGTTKERVQGTPDYIAPEQVKCMAATVQTDVFNLGAMMYAVLSGKKLPTLFTVKKAENSFLLDDRIASPHELASEIPESLSELVMNCVRSNPAKRPADMTDLVRRLEVVAYRLTRSHSTP